MIGMPHRGAAERVPHIGEIAIFEALKARVSHVPGKMQRVCRAGVDAVTIETLTD